MNIYLDADNRQQVNAAGSRISDTLVLYYQDQPYLLFNIIRMIDSVATPVDVSDAVAWQWSADKDFDQDSTPMCRTLNADIDKSQAADGIIGVPADATRTEFLTGLGTKQSISGYHELKGFNAAGKRRYYFQIPLTLGNIIDADGATELPVPDNLITEAQAYAMIHAAPERQFSIDGTLWHDTQNVTVDHFYRERRLNGEWSDPIEIPFPTSSWDAIEGKPETFPPANHAHSWDAIEEKPKLFSGNYTDLANKPSIPAAQVQSDWNATEGMGVVLNKPTIPAAQVQSDWNATEGMGVILNKPNVATQDGDGNIVQNVPAGKLTGTISIERLPAAAIERLVPVADDTARFALTTATVQNGDTVKVTATGKMYMVIDDTHLDTESGYQEYTAGAASSVPWSGVTNKPSIPAAQVQSDWNATEGMGVVLNKPTIPSTPSGVGLGNVTNIKNKLDAGVAPAVTDDGVAGYSVGSRWLDIAHSKVYECLSASTGAANWVEIINTSSADGCIDLSAVVINVGKDNIAGGYGAKIATYSNVATGGATAYRLTLEADNDLDMTKFVVGQQIYINANSMDENSPHVKIIAGVNETNNFVYLDSDIVCDPTSTVIGYNKTALSGYAVMARSSTTSNAIATGSKTFAYTSTVLGWAVGMRLKATGATATNWMSGIVTAFSATSVTINVDLVSGTGTFASWTLDLAGVGPMVGSACRFTAAAVDDFRAGQKIVIVPTAAGNTDPLQTNTIMHVDTVNNYIYLSALPVPVSVSFALSGYSASIAAVADATRATHAFSAGEDNFVTGEYADASGSINIAHGLGSHAEGINNSALDAGTHAEGMNNFANQTAAHVEGSGNVAAGLASHAEGISTKATGDAAHSEGQATLASGDCAHAGGANSKATGRNAFAHGTMSEANNDTATAIGYRAKANAKYSTVIGKDITLADTAENESAFAAGAIISRVNKAVLNPLYPADGERQYLPVPAARAEFAGQFKPLSQSITLSGAQTVTLDADKFSRVILAGTGTATLAMTNWIDGDRCELVIDTTAITPVIPIAWIMPEIDLAAAPRLYVLEIAQIGSSIFVAIKYPDIAESGTSSAELSEHIADTVRHTSDTERLAMTAAFNTKAPIASPTFTGTVGGITKAMVGLGNVDNTADASKPVSTAQQTALDLKAPIASPTFTGTVSGITKSMVGLGSVDNTADTAKPVSTAQQTALDLKAPIASPTFTGTVGGITKAMVGLGNVDNTADASKPVATTSVNGIMSAADKTKLDGIATGATAYVHPVNHPASIITQDASNRFITDAERTTWNAKQGALGYTAENTANKGVASGYASLDSSGLVPSTQLPSYVDDVIEGANLAAFPATGTTGKIYVALDTNKTYRWSGSAYIYITSGAVDSVAGKTGVVTLVKADVGLGNVDNTADTAKPVSTAQQTALDLKQNKASTRYSKGNITGAVAINAANGDYQVCTTTGTVTGITISNLATETGMILRINNSDGYAVTFGSTVIIAMIETGNYACAFYNDNSTICFMGKGQMI